MSFDMPLVETPPAPLIAVCGPTGAGKSALALTLAETFRGEIVNCDSLQLVRGFDAGTAKTPVAGRRGIPHHMIDVIDPAEVYSAGDYARDAREILREIARRGGVPVISGGTGFYLRALLDGLPQLPGRDPDLRARLEQIEARRAGRLWRLLGRLDRDTAARIHARDIQKLVRALEVRLLTRRPMPPAAVAEPLSGFRTLKIGLNPDRAALYKVLDARAEKMFLEGLVEEVGRLLAGGLTGGEKPFESLGYRQALAHVRGSMTLEEAIAATQLATRQYAKRQWTWFRRDSQIRWLDGFGADPEIVRAGSDIAQRFL
jgi:tRNA dimethylallyltransferase